MDSGGADAWGEPDKEQDSYMASQHLPTKHLLISREKRHFAVEQPGDAPVERVTDRTPPSMRPGGRPLKTVSPLY